MWNKKTFLLILPGTRAMLAKPCVMHESLALISTMRQAEQREQRVATGKFFDIDQKTGTRITSRVSPSDCRFMTI
jgi:hypothetical protein